MGPHGLLQPRRLRRAAGPTHHRRRDGGGGAKTSSTLPDGGAPRGGAAAATDDQRPPRVPVQFRERRDLEQYFWTTATVGRLLAATAPTGGPTCLAAPTLAHAWFTAPGAARRDVPLLDIDRRFDYLPGFRYWDMTAPLPLRGGVDGSGDGTGSDGSASDDDAAAGQVRVLVVDPPFFTVSVEQLVASILHLTVGRDGARTKLLIGYLRREAGPLLAALRGAFPGLRRTAFPLEYGHIKPNKWRNYVLYADVDLPGVRRAAAD